MNSFVNAVKNQESRTLNNMKAFKSTSDGNVDLFFKIGASRGKDIIPGFVAGLVEDENIAVRIALWARDIRGGAGERQLFRDILTYLELHRPHLVERIMPKIPELGRWDDLLVFKTSDMKDKAFRMIANVLNGDDQFAAQNLAKWMPREKSAKKGIATELREFLGWTPKFYRKTLASLTKAVETQMCANEWDAIEFSHVPSLAHSRYKKAFNRHTPKYAEYVAALVKGDDPKVKVNAGAVYPYDVIKGLGSGRINDFGKTEIDLAIKQWEALPNFVGDANILPLVDVSGSMNSPVGGDYSNKLTNMDVALSLGVYLAEKNTGKFKDTFLTFSSEPDLVHLKGNVVEKLQQMERSHWDMSTNLHAALDKILSVAKGNNVPQEEMPEMLLILSDMQFNMCIKYDDSAMEMIKRKYNNAGYDVPAIVFWNLNAYKNVPASTNSKGIALISGFSPSIVKSVLSADTEQFTPYGIMMKTIMVDRYNF